MGLVIEMDGRPISYRELRELLTEFRLGMDRAELPEAGQEIAEDLAKVVENLRGIRFRHQSSTWEPVNWGED